MFQIAREKFADSREFARLGYRCGTEAPSLARRRELAKSQAVFREATAFRAVVPLQFHLLYAPGTTPANYVADRALEEQIRILNRDYNGSGVSFRGQGRNDVVHPIWHEVTYDSQESIDCMREFNGTPDRQLNVYVCKIDMLGWASFPWDFAAYPHLDGVFITPKSLPLIGEEPYHLGKTLVHEVGHWCGLYHTFQGGCEPPGDEVDDTPNEAYPATGPIEELIGRDTCTHTPGADPIRNYMNYTDDAGMSEFTPGQVRRMRTLMTAYRGGFLTQDEE
jgi:hypothetical protein